MSTTIECHDLSPRAADGLLAAVHAAARAGGGTGLLLNLERLAFVGPYGLVLLCVIGRYARQIVSEVRLRCPASASLCQYLHRVRLTEALAPVVELEGDGWERHGRPGNPQTRALLELTPIAAREDVEATLARATGRVEAILAAELGYGEVEVSQFKNVVAELAHNILDHSGSAGYVAAQRYIDRGGRPWVEIGVGDLGVGIRASLNERFGDRQWSHGEAIRQSLQRDVSRGEGRGLGLYIVNRICREFDGSLHIRSGDTRMYLRRQRVRDVASGPFPGTQISISLGQRQPGEVDRVW